jgi:cytochrome P450
VSLEFDPLSSELCADPFPTYRRLRNEAPAYYSAKYDCWFLSRFEDIWRAEMERDVFSCAPGVTIGQLLTPIEIPAEYTAYQNPDGWGTNLQQLDPPKHTELRKRIAAHFQPAAVRKLEPYVRDIVRRYADELVARGGGDAVGDYAMRVSVRAACAISGFPLEDADRLAGYVNSIFEREPGSNGQSFSGPGLLAGLAMRQYLVDFVRERRKRPGDAASDLFITRAREFAGRDFGDDEIASHLTLLLVGGTETLPKVASAALHRLWQNPAQREQVVANPELAAHAFHEALRLDMPTQMLGRRVVREIDFHGQRMRPGQNVMYLWASANRDEREFSEPERYDLHRRAPRILSFGHGAHLCLGKHVALMEGRVLIQELLARAPRYEVEESRAQRFRSEFFRGFATLPIRVPGGRVTG